MPIYLKIAGLNGDSTNAKFKGWFEVDNFDFGATRPTSANGSGKGAGPVSFSPLTVDIHSLTGLAPLLADLTANKVLKTVELVDVSTNSEGAAQVVYDIKLTNAVLDKISFAPGARETETALSFDFQKVSLTDQGVSSKGGPSVETTNASALHFSAGGAATPDTVTPVPATSKVHYFLKVDGVNGDVSTLKFKDWFAVDGFDFGALRPTSSAAGNGIGRVSFSPLTVDLSSLTGLAPLLQDLTSGKIIKSVELVGVDSNPEGKEQTVYDLKLSNAQLVKYDNAPGAKETGTGLSFDFQKVSLTDHGLTSEGSESTTANALRFTGAGAATPGTVTPVPATSKVHYFLKIDGVNGSVSTSGFKGWFAVDGFDFGATRPTGSSATGGGGAGKVAFSPLTVDLSSLTGLAPLLKDLTTHKDIKSVELVGVDSNPEGKELTVYDLKLSDAQLLKYDNAPGAKGVETGLSFDFHKVSLTDHGFTSEGSESTTANALHFTAGGAATSDTVTPVPAKSPVHYFLKIDGVNGSVNTVGFKGWFAVDGFDFGATAPASSSATGGAGAGRVAFTPLTVDVSSLVGLAPLLKDLTTHKDIKSVELVGVDSNPEGKELTVYDLKLSNAVLVKYDNAPGAKEVATGLSFDYKEVSLTDHGLTGGGSESTTASASRFTAPGAAVPATITPVPASSKVHYFLKVDGVNGSVSTLGFKGWFAVDGFDFGATAPSGSSATGGGGAGKVAFTPLTVDVTSLAGLAPLLKDLTTHKNIKSVELVGVDSSNEGKAQTVYDIKLTNAVLDKFSNAPGANEVATGLSFDYKEVSLTDHGLTGGGSESTIASASRFATGAGAPDTVTPVPEKSAMQYFLKVDGVNGSVTDLKFKDWFKVDGFGFAATAPTGSSATGGAGAGKVAFSPLTVDINTVAGQAPLLADLTSSHDIKSLELVGAMADPKTGQLDQIVYDLKLNNALLSMVQSAAGFPGVDTRVAFDFQKATLTDHGTTSQGTLSGSPESISFNTVTQRVV
jgi:type VI protein secretion system component Hcp